MRVLDIRNCLVSSEWNPPESTSSAHRFGVLATRPPQHAKQFILSEICMVHCKNLPFLMTGWSPLQLSTQVIGPKLNIESILNCDRLKEKAVGGKVKS